MLIKPLITEKTMAEATLGKFTFVVDVATNKTEVRAEVEKMFKVNVLGVSIRNVPGKNHRTGKKWMFAKFPDWKKATVKLKKGQKIELFETKK